MLFPSAKTKNITKKIGSQAIVIGGGIAGLLSARVLADYFSEIIIIDKDELPKTPVPRKGVPQSVQPHVLFAKGYRILEEFFPGIGLQLIEKGALQIDWAREFYTFAEAGWYANTSEPSEVVSFTCSRPLLEWTIRQQISKLNQIRFLEQHRVTGLIYDSDSNKVTGVNLYASGNSSHTSLSAELIVDASGRNSKAPDWLENIGFASPPKTVVNPLLGYATCRYREPKNFQANWKIMLINQLPPDKTRLGYLARIENREWIATLGG